MSVRTRFEVFKRDDFTCRYCGLKTPQVVLQVDHIIAIAEGGTDDMGNLVTACWECNSGKSDRPLSDVALVNDPTDQAILMLERERQLRELQFVQELVREREDEDVSAVCEYWHTAIALFAYPPTRLPEHCARHAVRNFSKYEVMDYIDVVARKSLRGLSAIKYFSGIIRTRLERKNAGLDYNALPPKSEGTY